MPLKNKADYLPMHKEIILYQREDMFKLNTDTSLLGEFYSFFDGETLLDIGTNNGALLLYSLLKGKGKLIGVDVFQEALDQAKENLKLNNLEATLILKDAKELDIDKVDVIISNPPFFKKNEFTPSKDKFLLVARHEELLPLEELFKCVKRNLKENGRFYLIHRYERKDEIINCALKYGLTLKENKDIFDSRVNKYVQSLFYFTF